MAAIDAEAMPSTLINNADSEIRSRVKRSGPECESGPCKDPSLKATQSSKARIWSICRRFSGGRNVHDLRLEATVNSRPVMSVHISQQGRLPGELRVFREVCLSPEV